MVHKRKKVLRVGVKRTKKKTINLFDKIRKDMSMGKNISDALIDKAVKQNLRKKRK